jgi:ketosteroid isomerase-like protein
MRCDLVGWVHAAAAAGLPAIRDSKREDYAMARSTKQVFDDHMAAIESGDVSRIVADYAEDAIMMTLDGALVGKQAIRAGFEGLLQGFPNVKFTSQDIVEGDTLLTVWTAECDTATMPQGVDTFIIREGKIQRQTAWFVVNPK